jgi:hypothetical protein
MSDLYRTVIHVDSVFDFPEGSGEFWMRCTPGGVDMPEGSILMRVTDLPEALQATAEEGKVFFAHVQLDARRSWECTVDRIEDHWGITDGFLHFEEGE